MRQIAAWLAIIILLATGCSADDRVVLAAGTTLVDSGFIERVLADYPSDVQVSVVGVSSLEALALGSNGSAELLITHLPDAEAAFIADHPGATQQPIFSSHFVLIGPDAVQLATGDPVAALRMIADAGYPFVSRGDGSGTAAKEQELWELAGVDPSVEPWYSVTGQGMGFTLQVADQRDAFTLTEIGSFRRAESITLMPFVGGDQDERLRNPYRLTLVEGASDESRAVFRWLASLDGFEAITTANIELFGEPLYSATSPEIQT